MLRTRGVKGKRRSASEGLLTADQGNTLILSRMGACNQNLGEYKLTGKKSKSEPGGCYLQKRKRGIRKRS